MIDAIVYSSLSGSCEEYAQRMSAALHIPFFTEKSGLCPVGRKIAYIGWLFAGKVVGLDKAMDRYDVCCVVSVGMGDPAVNPAEVCRKKNASALTLRCSRCRAALTSSVCRCRTV